MICVECDPDEALVVALGFLPSNIRHEYGKGKVCNTLKRKSGWVAMLDEDPASAQPSYLRGLAEQEYNQGMRLFEDTTRKNRVVLLCPRLEEWLIETARKDSLDLEKFGLSMNARSLHEIIMLRKENVARVAVALRTSQRFQALAQWLGTETM
ncbi:MAG: hypothetical protein G01um101433_237 [Parcubacteria group bacterium Gr01-1014_33]|nr:MAG: hypothetical protein G01um101433_237 [Parcubacteria group bacterium Gr01-1014_33]